MHIRCNLEEMDGFAGPETMILSYGIPISRIIPVIDTSFMPKRVDEYLTGTLKQSSLDGRIPLFVPGYHPSLYPSVEVAIERCGETTPVRKFF